MSLKAFYEGHLNFSARNLSDYFISPGIKCKFDLIVKYIGSKRKYDIGLDLGSSGNSILYFVHNINKKAVYDIASASLKQYSYSKKSLKNFDNWYPLCGDITSLPYKDSSFDIIFALDVLEHVKDDAKAIREISRITKFGGLIIITVPHRERSYSNQDMLIGHYRRYEIQKLVELCENHGLEIIDYFGIYGQIMKISLLQTASPKLTESSILKLRRLYLGNLLFRSIWRIFVRIGSWIMKIDARYQSPNRIMNMAFVFKKIS